MTNFDDYTYFVLVRNGNATYSFTGYMDNESGQIRTIHYGKRDPKGNHTPYRFRFDRAHRTIRVRRNQKDINGESIPDFLRGMPECEGSPNGSYSDGKQMNIWFREINDGKDAVYAIEAKELKIKAETVALNLEGEELRDVAILCGTFTQDPLMQKHRVLEYAGAAPDEFMDMYNGPERIAKALLKRAEKEKLIRVRGQIYIWEDVTIGANESLAISKIMTDPVLADAIRVNLKPTAAAVKVEAPVEKKPVPNPVPTPKKKAYAAEVVDIPEVEAEINEAGEDESEGYEFVEDDPAYFADMADEDDEDFEVDESK